RFPHDPKVIRAFWVSLKQQHKHSDANELKRWAQTQGQKNKALHNALTQNILFPAVQTTSSAPKEDPSWMKTLPSYCTSIKIRNGQWYAKGCHPELQQKERKGELVCQRKILLHQKYLITHDCAGHIFALSRRDGRMLWATRLTQGPLRTHVQPPLATQQSHKIWMNHRTRVMDLKRLDQYVLVALNEGRFEWGRGWVSGIRHQLHIAKLSLRTGRIEKHRISRGDFVSNTLSLHNQTLAYWGQKLQVLDAHTLRPQWSSQRLGTYGSWIIELGNRTPIAQDTQRLYTSNHGTLQAFRRIDGKRLWSKQLHINVHAVRVAHNVLVVATDDAYWQAFSAKTGIRLWKHKVSGSSFRKYRSYWSLFRKPFEHADFFRIFGRRIVGITTGGLLRTLQLRTGKVLWERPLYDHVHHPPTLNLQRQTLCLIGDSGTLQTFKLNGGKATGTQKVNTSVHRNRQQIYSFSTFMSSLPQKGQTLGLTVPLCVGQRWLIGHTRINGQFVLRSAQLPKTQKNPKKTPYFSPALRAFLAKHPRASEVLFAHQTASPLQPTQIKTLQILPPKSGRQLLLKMVQKTQHVTNLHQTIKQMRPLFTRFCTPSALGQPLQATLLDIRALLGPKRAILQSCLLWSLW
ncbi:MAG: PQQ-binding-like beta-propeller repeat protein, partial [Myxococcota bacterium]